MRTGAIGAGGGAAPNPYAGEVALVVNGTSHLCRLTLGALATLDSGHGDESLIALIERFEAGRFSARDVMAVVIAGLRGGGWTGGEAELVAAEIEGGPIGCARAAGLMLTRAFALPEGKGC